MEWEEEKGTDAIKQSPHGIVMTSMAHPTFFVILS